MYNNDDAKSIEIEIFPLKIADKIASVDFSINAGLIPISSITEFCDPEDEVNIAIWFWEYIVENGLDDIDVDSIKDIAVNKILKVPQLGKEREIMRIYPTMYHFWKAQELMEELPGFHIDEELMKIFDESVNLLVIGFMKSIDKQYGERDYMIITKLISDYCPLNKYEVKEVAETVSKTSYVTESFFRCTLSTL